MNATSLPAIVEKLEQLTFTGEKDEQIRKGTNLARHGVAALVVGDSDPALKLALEAMAKDPRWWDLAVEIGQWCGE